MKGGNERKGEEEEEDEDKNKGRKNEVKKDGRKEKGGCME